MDIKLIFNLLFGVFSLDSKNMRWFSLRRILVSILILPLFLILLIINQAGLLLDNLLFPSFKKQEIKSPCFIIAAPRSATTFLYHSLAKIEDKFTCIKLWEIVFAPSIIQKYFFLFLFSIDKSIHSPLRKSIPFFERKLFNKLIKMHEIGLNLPEEDEAMLLWYLSTAYLQFFYPDSHFFDAYFEFDNALNSKTKNRIMKTYSRLIKRHNYVFNREQKKMFLSKNPYMMAKMRSLYNLFPDAKIITINRCPSQTIPSTISLSAHLYAMFSGIETNESLKVRTQELLIKWYQMFYENAPLFFKGQLLTLDFRALIAQDKSELKLISNLLELDDGLIELGMSKLTTINSASNYKALNKEELNSVLDQLSFMKKHCA